ncbi:MAG: glycosyltransferase family 2 protein [Lachnospiraceae bacterium]|nr:glycosyltransferase family 2 protein [Lachnospiraceae bacterium]
MKQMTLITDLTGTGAGAGRYLSRWIGQTLTDTEFFVCCDDSDPEAREACRKCAMLDSRVTFRGSAVRDRGGALLLSAMAEGAQGLMIVETATDFSPEEDFLEAVMAAAPEALAKGAGADVVVGGCRVRINRACPDAPWLGAVLAAGEEIVQSARAAAAQAEDEAKTLRESGASLRGKLALTKEQLSGTEQELKEKTMLAAELETRITELEEALAEKEKAVSELTAWRDAVMSTCTWKLRRKLRGEKS